MWMVLPNLRGHDVLDSQTLLFTKKWPRTLQQSLASRASIRQRWMDPGALDPQMANQTPWVAMRLFRGPSRAASLALPSLANPGPAGQGPAQSTPQPSPRSCQQDSSATCRTLLAGSGLPSHCSCLPATARPTHRRPENSILINPFLRPSLLPFRLSPRPGGPDKASFCGGLGGFGVGAGGGILHRALNPPRRSALDRFGWRCCQANHHFSLPLSPHLHAHPTSFSFVSLAAVFPAEPPDQLVARWRPSASIGCTQHTNFISRQRMPAATKARLIQPEQDTIASLPPSLSFRPGRRPPQPVFQPHKSPAQKTLLRPCASTSVGKRGRSYGPAPDAAADPVRWRDRRRRQKRRAWLPPGRAKRLDGFASCPSAFNFEAGSIVPQSGQKDRSQPLSWALIHHD